MNWRREPKVGLQSLPHERKVLAERYTIDAEEAERRAQLAEEQARQAAAEESARRAAEQRAARRAADQGARRAAEEAAMQAAEPPDTQSHPDFDRVESPPFAPVTLSALASRLAQTELARTDPAASEPLEPKIAPAEPEATPDEDPAGETADLPIYRWFGTS